MAITDWAIEDRPREKLLQRGPEALSDAELLAIFLRTGIKGKTAVDLARDILSDAGGLRELLGANEARFCQSKGLGQAKFVQLQAVVEMSRRYLEEKLRHGEALTDVNAVRNYLTHRLRGYPYEVFACLFLDNKHRVIEYEELFRGTIDSASVHPREVVRHAIHHNAAAIIFAHNHPSGVAEPSQADHRITDRLKEALNLVDVRVLDHFVIGDEVVSFAERGYL
ncbi:RadC family protein [Leucothrix mucor]|uniref:RadC family protein n=1 Tax=Leucothrix mucor TaxID=45248 RepID=UPI0003B4B446|nr:DNA repair protein RadC [Leucothrix mucor]